jgi:hypothetical protein
MPKKTPVKPSSPALIQMIPDWSYWENLSTVSLREALQLSLGLDPHTHVPALEEDMSLREHYWKRLLVSLNHAPEADWVFGRVVREEGQISPEYTDVYLQKFADWIVHDTTLEPFSEKFRGLTKTLNKADAKQPQNPATPQTQPQYLLLNGDTESEFYFARQSLAVLEDLLRHHRGNIAVAAGAIGIQRQHLSRVINNLRAGRRAWSDK